MKYDVSFPLMDGRRYLRIQIFVEGGKIVRLYPSLHQGGRLTRSSALPAVVEDCRKVLERILIKGEKYTLRKVIDTGIFDLSWMTLFDRSVYSVLMGVGPGETVSYGRLAELAGFPGASRAVGRSMGKNRLPLVIPCHRVIKSDGKTGGYGGGVHVKEALLAHEERFRLLGLPKK